MDNKNILIGIIGVFVLIFMLNKMGLISSQESAYASLPNDLQLTRVKFPLQYDFKLLDGINIITFNQGLNLSNIYKAEIYIRGCHDADLGDSEKIIISGTTFETGLQRCQSLFYADGSGQEYQHYADRTIDVNPFLLKRTIDINVMNRPASKVIARTLKVFENVDCTRSSQCPLIKVGNNQVQPICDSNYHMCTLLEIPISSSGTTPEKIVYLPSSFSLKDIPIWIWIIIVFILILFFVRRKNA